MLTHYIFVRRDLPVGVIASMVTHAAGESAAAWQRMQRKRTEKLPAGTVAVVLEAKNEDHLSEIWGYVRAMAPTIRARLIVDGQRMAIGVYPIERNVGDVLFSEFDILRTCQTLDNGPAIHDNV